MPSRLAAMCVGLVLAVSACGSDDEPTATTDAPDTTTSAAGPAVSGDAGSDEVERIECEDAISVADVARITALPITTCFSGKFRTEDSRGLDIDVRRHPSAEAAREEAALDTGDGSHFSGEGWEAIERLGGVGAAAGEVSVRITVAGFGDGSFEERTDDELRAMYSALLDALAAKAG